MPLADFIDRPYEGPGYCMRLARAYLAEQGVPLPDVAAPGEAPRWCRVERPQANDVVVFNIFGLPRHVGVCLGRGQFLHCEEGRLSEVADLAESLWSSRIEGYYRWAK